MPIAQNKGALQCLKDLFRLNLSVKYAKKICKIDYNKEKIKEIK